MIAGPATVLAATPFGCWRLRSEVGEEEEEEERGRTCENKDSGTDDGANSNAREVEGVETTFQTRWRSLGARRQGDRLRGADCGWIRDVRPMQVLWVRHDVFWRWCRLVLELLVGVVNVVDVLRSKEGGAQDRRERGQSRAPVSQRAGPRR